MFMTLLVVIEQVFVRKAGMDHAIDRAPVGQAAEVAIVDEEVGLEFAREMAIGLGRLLGVVAVDGIELQAALAAESDGLVEQFAFTNAPEDELVALVGELAQCLDGERQLAANGGITMFDNSAVKIYSNGHVKEKGKRIRE